jgi:hypothetical protein
VLCRSVAINGGVFYSMADQRDNKEHFEAEIKEFASEGNCVCDRLSVLFKDFSLFLFFYVLPFPFLFSFLSLPFPSFLFFLFIQIFIK